MGGRGTRSTSSVPGSPGTATQKEKTGMPNSSTGFADANTNATTRTTCVPVAIRDQAAARDEHEQEDDAAPKTVDSPMHCIRFARTLLSRGFGTSWR